MNMRKNNQNWKKNFRSSKAWKEFRDKIKKKQINDPVTLQKLTIHANLHHMDLDEEHYMDLSNEDNFVFVNQKTHECIHYLFLKSKPKEWRKRLMRLIPILEKMELLNTTNKV